MLHFPNFDKLLRLSRKLYCVMALSHQKVWAFVSKIACMKSSPIRNFKKLLWLVTKARVELVGEPKAGITGTRVCPTAATSRGLVMGDEYEVQHPSFGWRSRTTDGRGDQQFCREVQRPCQLNLSTKAPSRWCGLSCPDALRPCRFASTDTYK